MENKEIKTKKDLFNFINQDNKKEIEILGFKFKIAKPNVKQSLLLGRIQNMLVSDILSEESGDHESIISTTSESSEILYRLIIELVYDENDEKVFKKSDLETLKRDNSGITDILGSQIMSSLNEDIIESKKK